MKKVFRDISEVAHLWASQAQPEATNSRNFYYHGLTIYSYGSHFPIAQIWDKDNNTVFFTSREYSSTTSGHKSVVHYAINHKRIFTVPEVCLNDKYGTKELHNKNVRYYLDTLESLINKQNKARKYDYRPTISATLTEFQEYTKLFRLSHLLTKTERKLLVITDSNELFSGCDFTELRLKRAKAETRKQIEANKKRLFAWLGCKVPYKENKVYLRAYNDNIETSKGANVPIREAEILYNRIKQGKDIKGYKIGYYTVISLNGVLKIGCHEIERAEIDRLAKVLNW